MERKRMDNTKFREVTLGDLWDLLVRKLVVLVLATVVAVAGSVAIVKMTYTPQYASTATLYILRQSDRDSSSDTANDFSLALKLVNDCTYMLKSHAVLDEVIDQLDLDMTYEDLYDRIETNNPSDTRILEVTVTMGTAEEAKEIVDTLCQIGPQAIANAMGFEQLNLFEYGTLEQEPCNQVGMMTYGLVGIAAAVLTYCVYLLRLLLDDRIHSGDDLEQRLGVSTLGYIPHADRRHKDGYGYGAYAPGGKKPQKKKER